MELMITTERAREIIQAVTKPLDPVTVSLNKSYGKVLATNIFASGDFPAFLQSNMDGYAYKFEEGINRYKITGAIAAGDQPDFILEQGTATRIFTGAPLPKGADTVLIQEKASVQGGYLHVMDPHISKGSNTRAVGSIIKKNELALPAGTLLTAPVVGFLAGIGIGKLSIYPTPRIQIITTGNELQMPGDELQPGQVYESNSFALEAALLQLSLSDIGIVAVRDDLEAITATLKQSLRDCDLILLTGGVSVGDHDYTQRAFESAGVTTLFHKVKQKPGKPLLFGQKENKIVFGLPGNPASVLTCFYEYVLQALSGLTSQSLTLKEAMVPLSDEYKKPAGLTHFVRAFYDGESVRLLQGQESYKTGSFKESNCLAVIPEQTEYLHKGAIVTVHHMK